MERKTNSTIRWFKTRTTMYFKIDRQDVIDAMINNLTLSISIMCLMLSIVTRNKPFKELG